jgi:hypothetical protein
MSRRRCGGAGRAVTGVARIVPPLRLTSRLKPRTMLATSAALPHPCRDGLLTLHPGLGVKVFLGEETLYRQSVAIEVDGKRWVPVPDATATAEEFIAALALLHEIHQQIRWSPWVMQDRAGEYDEALKVCGQ